MRKIVTHLHHTETRPILMSMAEALLPHHQNYSCCFLGLEHRSAIINWVHTNIIHTYIQQNYLTKNDHATSCSYCGFGHQCRRIPSANAESTLFGVEGKPFKFVLVCMSINNTVNFVNSK